MGRIGETLMAGTLLLTGATAIGTAEYLRNNSEPTEDNRADVCTMGLDQQGQIDCFVAVAQTQGAEQAALYFTGSGLMIAGLWGVAKTQQKYSVDTSPNSSDKQATIKQ
ncbi:MAG TPA: hypothetical protein PKB09_00080 [Candidatus Saccharibacteria bacterium]|nr:hypothetical protein [Candidatus Saccharibacteria bacterium]